MVVERFEGLFAGRPDGARVKLAGGVDAHGGRTRSAQWRWSPADGPYGTCGMQLLMQAFPQPGPGPLDEPAVRGRAADAEQYRWHLCHKLGEREVVEAMLDHDAHLPGERSGLLLITDKGFASTLFEQDHAHPGTSGGHHRVLCLPDRRPRRRGAHPRARALAGVGPRPAAHNAAGRTSHDTRSSTRIS